MGVGLCFEMSLMKMMKIMKTMNVMTNHKSLMRMTTMQKVEQAARVVILLKVMIRIMILRALVLSPLNLVIMSKPPRKNQVHFIQMMGQRGRKITELVKVQKLTPISQLSCQKVFME